MKDTKIGETLPRIDGSGLTLQKGMAYSAKGMTFLIGAGAITIGLLCTMTTLISDEFKPQDKIELAEFDFNPNLVEPPVIIDRAPPKPLDPIDIPPPPPTLDVTVTARPQEPVSRNTDITESFDPGRIRIPVGYTINTADADPQPIHRARPNMPSRADRSGHCRVSFDVSPDGKPFNIQARFCTQSHFERPATQSVAKWTYRPKIQDGLPVTRTNMETLIRFNLSDEHGNIIPE